MGAITPTQSIKTEFSGAYHLQIFTATIASASDTIDLSSYFTTIQGAIAVITGGMDADFQALQVSFSGTTVTVVSKQADGANADEFTGTTIQLWVVGKYEGNTGS